MLCYRSCVNASLNHVRGFHRGDNRSVPGASTFGQQLQLSTLWYFPRNDLCTQPLLPTNILRHPFTRLRGL